MGSFGSKAETPQEQMKGYKREVDRAIRELDRERRKMEMQNERLVQDIKKAAKQNQAGVVRIMAKDYVRVKRSITKFYQLRTYLQVRTGTGVKQRGAGARSGADQRQYSAALCGLPRPARHLCQLSSSCLFRAFSCVLGLLSSMMI